MGKDYHTITDDDTYEKSKINPAAIINITMENLWRDAFSFQSKNKLYEWDKKLDSLWLILGGDEPEQQENSKKRDFVKEFNEIDKRIKATGSLIHRPQGFKQLDGDEAEIIDIQYDLLKEKSLFLRRLQNKQGKGTAYDMGEEDYMG